MAEQIQAGISFEAVDTQEQTWKPPEKQVQVVLEPVPGEEIFYPASGPTPIEVAEPIDAQAVIINIETTGVMPFESRLISIAAADVRSPENIVDFTGQNEKDVLQAFLDWFNLMGFRKIIGYNVSFDYRFLFTKAMKYALQVPEFYKAVLYDVMNKMEQVKEEFVYGFNSPGKLDEWTMYFFGDKGLMTYEDVLRAWEKKDLDAIAKHNRKKVEITVLLYALLLYTQGEISV